MYHHSLCALDISRNWSCLPSESQETSLTPPCNFEETTQLALPETQAETPTQEDSCMSVHPLASDAPEWPPL